MVTIYYQIRTTTIINLAKTISFIQYNNVDLCLVYQWPINQSTFILVHCLLTTFPSLNVNIVANKCCFSLSMSSGYHGKILKDQSAWSRLIDVHIKPSVCEMDCLQQITKLLFNVFYVCLLNLMSMQNILIPQFHLQQNQMKNIHGNNSS